MPNMNTCRNFWVNLNPVKRDVIVLSSIIVLSYTTMMYIDLAELISNSLSAYEYLQLDEIPYLILLVALSLAIFTKNRMADLKRSIHLKELAEEKSATLLVENQLLTQHVMEVQERERLELARELHDEIGQYLTGISLDIATLTAYQDERIALLANRISNNCRMTRNISRKLIRRLRPSSLDSQGIKGAIHATVKEWISYHPQIRIDTEIDSFTKDTDEKTNITIYRVVQESLTNIAKHAQAKHVKLALLFNTSNQSIHLAIQDDGIGIQLQSRPLGFGLIGMRERVHAVHGQLSIHSNYPRGTSIEVTIPLTPFNQNLR
jgi:signal transduction histidine kinase